MKQFVTIIVFFVCCMTYVNAQTFLDRLRIVDNTLGKVTVIQSKTIDELVNGRKQSPTQKHKKDTILVNNGVPKSVTDSTKNGKNDSVPVVDNGVVGPARKIMGFRVQVFAGNNSRVSRNKARDIGEHLKSEFPEHAVYVHFYSPRWICRMGNYKTREEAEVMLQKVKDLGYSRACLVKGKITVH